MPIIRAFSRQADMMLTRDMVRNFECGSGRQSLDVGDALSWREFWLVGDEFPVREKAFGEYPMAEMPARTISLRLTFPALKAMESLLASSSLPRSKRQRVLADSVLKGSRCLLIVETSLPEEFEGSPAVRWKVEAGSTPL